jgi:hypothetical protein
VAASAAAGLSPDCSCLRCSASRSARAAFSASLLIVGPAASAVTAAVACSAFVAGCTGLSPAAALGGDPGGVPCCCWLSCGFDCLRRIREGSFCPEALIATPLVSAAAVVLAVGLRSCCCCCCSATVFFNGRFPSCKHVLGISAACRTLQGMFLKVGWPPTSSSVHPGWGTPTGQHGLYNSPKARPEAQTAFEVAFPML